MKKVLFVATVTGHILAFHIPYLKMFKDNGYEVSVASCGGEDIEYCDCHYNIPMQRNPFSLKNIKSYRQLKNIIEKENFEIVHCHTPVAGILTRLAARKARKHGTRVIYTAHGFHFFKGAPLKNWLMYCPDEKLCSRYTDTLITINTEDFELAKNKFKAKEVKYIPGVGIDTEKFKNITVDKQTKRAELGLTDENIVLLSVGELNENKNHQVIIKSLGKIQNPNIHYLIAGVGNKKEELEQLAKTNNVNLQMLGYRKDIPELLQISDIYTHPSRREGLSVALMEAMASGKACVISDIRGNRDLIKNEEGGYLVKSTDVDGFYKAINELVNNKSRRELFGNYNKKTIEKFDIENVETIMRGIYGK